MIQGFEGYAPLGKVIETDRRCTEVRFCDFYDAGEWTEYGRGEGPQKGMLKCVHCNEEMPESEFDIVDLNTINASRKKQIPNWPC